MIIFATMKKYLIVGLGNIGAEYDATRHNIGFDVCDALVIKHEGTFKTEKLAMRSEIKIKGRPVVVIKPTTYMNLSGKAVHYWMDKEKISLENVLIIMDDLALPIDALRLRGSGSHAGHNGLRDIEAVLGHNKYARLRFGIGNDFPKGRQADFVLSRWDKNELPTVIDKIKKSVEMVESFVFVGLERTMNLFNSKK